MCFVVIVWHPLLLSTRNCAEIKSANQLKEAFTSKLSGLDSDRREYSLKRIFLGLPQHSLMSSGKVDIGITAINRSNVALKSSRQQGGRDRPYHHSLEVATKVLAR